MDLKPSFPVDIKTKNVNGLIETSYEIQHTFEDKRFANLKFNVQREKHLLDITKIKNNLTSIHFESFEDIHIFHFNFNSIQEMSNVHTEISFNFKKGVIIHGHLHDQQENKRYTILNEILSFSKFNSTIQIKSTQRTLTQIYKNAKINFSSNKINTRDAKESLKRGIEEEEGDNKIKNQKKVIGRNENLLGGFISWLSNSWNKVIGFAKRTVNIVKATYDFLESGNFNYSNSYNLTYLAWNINPQTNNIIETNIQIDDFLTCVSCGSDLITTLNLEVDISDYTLNMAKIYLDSSTVNIFQFLINGEYSSSNETEIYSQEMEPYLIYLGEIPAYVNLNFVLSLGYELNVAISSNVTYGYSLNGSIVVGVGYSQTQTPSNFWIYQNDVQRTPIPKIGFDNSQLSINTNVYLLSQITLRIDYIGGPFISMKLYAENIFEAGSQACNGTSFIQETLNVGYDVGIGAQIAILDTINKTFGPADVFSKKYKIFNLCYDNNNNNLANSANFSSGNTWSGYQYNCPPEDFECPPADMTVQLLSFYEGQDNTYYIVISGSIIAPIGNCVYQNLFVGGFTNISTLQLQLVPSDDQYAQQIDWNYCSGQYQVKPSSTFTLYVDDNNNLYYSDVTDSGCTCNIYLYTDDFTKSLLIENRNKLNKKIAT